MKKNSKLSSVELQIILLAHCNITVSARTISSQWNVLAFSTDRVIAFSMERILVQNALQLMRNFGVPAAFYFAFYLRSSNAFPVRLLLSGTVFVVP